jgi:hypothetical protein
VQRAGWRLLPKPLSRQDSDGLLSCATPAQPWSCLPSSARGVQQALTVAVELRPSDTGTPTLVLIGKAFVTSPAMLVTHQRFCSRCADDKLAEAATDLTLQLLNELQARSGRTVLDVRSTPSNAIVSIDGQPTGATPDTFNTFPGAHVVSIEKPGFQTETVQITAEEGKTATVAVALRSIPAPTSASRSWLPLGLVGGGAVLAVGGALIYADQQDGPDDKYRHSRATAVGISIGVVGLAAIGTGAFLWWRDSSASSKTAARTSTPVLSLTGGGGWVGWASTF